MVKLLFEDNKVYLDDELLEYGESLILEHMDITEVEGKIPDELHGLSINNNKVRDLSRLDVNNLYYIAVEYNKIERIDNFQVKNMLEAYFSYNRITTLDGFNPSNLEYLGVSHNLIEEVNGIDTSHLRALFLNNNKIKKINFNTGNLNSLGLFYNQLESIDGLTIDANLDELYLSNNKLTEFKKPVNLIYLTLCDNKITSPFDVECSNVRRLTLDNMLNEKEEVIEDSEMLYEYRDYIIRKTKKSAKK